MKYYKVKEEYDQNKRKDGSILVQNELYTEKEVEKYKIPKEKLELVEVKKNSIYFFFGARFSNESNIVQNVMSKSQNIILRSIMNT